MRKLVTIQCVSDIKEIPNALNICMINVLGWWCVALKKEFKIGDMCVYHEIDSFLPIISRYEFLGKGSSPKKMVINGEYKLGYRLKTARKLNHLSQGLALPIYQFPEIKNPIEGTDVTELLGIHKYEPPLPACLAGEAKGIFPGFIPKTDEPRCLSGEDTVQTPKGIRTIKDIVDNNYRGKILSFDHSKNKEGYSSVTGVSKKRNNFDWYLIKTLSGKNIIVTGNHLIWIDNLKCYREVRDIHQKDVVLCN